MESHEIFEILWNNFTVASERATAADRRCMAAIHEVPNGLPHPDGLKPVQDIVRELNSARQEMIEAEGRLTAFIVEGIVPDNLKGSAQGGKRSVDGEKRRQVKRGRAFGLRKGGGYARGSKPLILGGIHEGADGEGRHSPGVAA